MGNAMQSRKGYGNKQIFEHIFAFECDNVALELCFYEKLEKILSEKVNSKSTAA